MAKWGKEREEGVRQTKRSPLSQQGKRRVHDLFLGVDERPYSVKDRRHLSIFNSQELFWPEKANSCLMGTLQGGTNMDNLETHLL